MTDQFDEAAGYLLDALGGPHTPEMLLACRVWTRHESGPRIIGNNPWNLHIGGSCPQSSHAGVLGLNPSQRFTNAAVPGLIGNRYAGVGDKNVAIFGTLRTGVEACARNLMRATGRFYGYDRVVAAARKGDAEGFLVALAKSSWSAGRYGTRNGGRNVLLDAYNAAKPTPPPTDTSGDENPVLPITGSTPSTIELAKGTQLYDLNGKPKVKMSGATTIVSLGQSGAYDLVPIKTGTEPRQLLLVRSVDAKNRR